MLLLILTARCHGISNFDIRGVNKEEITATLELVIGIKMTTSNAGSDEISSKNDISVSMQTM